MSEAFKDWAIEILALVTAFTMGTVAITESKISTQCEKPEKPAISATKTEPHAAAEETPYSEQ